MCPNSNEKKRSVVAQKSNYNVYDWEFGLFERAWGRRGVACPDCVNESNHKVWERFLDRAVRKLLCAETMETEEFRELLEEVREEEAQRLVWEKRAEKMAEARRRRSCMARPKIDYVPKGLAVDLEEAYAEYFKQEVEFRPENKEDFLYMLRLLERWEKKSIPAVLAKWRPDAAYAIAMGLCEHLWLLIKREDIEEYLGAYKQRIGKLVYAGFAALVESARAWNNEEKRKVVVAYIGRGMERFDGYGRMRDRLSALIPMEPLKGEPVAVVREMSVAEERAAREAEQRRLAVERQRREAEKEARSLIPLNREYEEKVFNSRNVDWDCHVIWQLMLKENRKIERLLAAGEYQTGALRFLQLTKSMCRHFVMDRHWEYFDDMYSPEYAIEDLVEAFEKLAKEGRLPEEVNRYIHEAWKEIEETECCRDYGVPRGTLPF